MWSQPRNGKKPVRLASMIPARLAHRHLHRCHLRPALNTLSTFLRSLRSRPITALLRYYGRSDSWPPDSGTRQIASACSTCGQVSLIHALGLPTIPSPTASAGSVSPRHATYGRIEPRTHPTTGTTPQGNSGLRLSLAGSPPHAGRIEFVILRTSRSPPAASHPALRRRGCDRLQGTLSWRGLLPL